MSYGQTKEMWKKTEKYRKDSPSTWKNIPKRKKESQKARKTETNKYHEDFKIKWRSG